MNDVARGLVATSWRFKLFTLVKYLTYALLSFNTFLFFEQEMGSASYALAGSGFDPAVIVQLFSATLDTAAWVVLLLLFELETAVIPDERLVGFNKLAIHSVRLVCGAAIVFAWFGYVGEWEVFLEATSTPAAPCDLVGQGWTIMQGFDDFVALDAMSCSALGMDALQVTQLDNVLASPQAFSDAHDLALIDVINAGAWILVVIVLEIEVRLQLRGGVPPRFQWLMTVSKVIVYATLALAAVYWGFEGDFLDFWDAALWLFAFVFIEMNVFEWQVELELEQEQEQELERGRLTVEKP